MEQRNSCFFTALHIHKPNAFDQKHLDSSFPTKYLWRSKGVHSVSAFLRFSNFYCIMLGKTLELFARRLQICIFACNILPGGGKKLHQLEDNLFSMTKINPSQGGMRGGKACDCWQHIPTFSGQICLAYFSLPTSTKVLSECIRRP